MPPETSEAPQDAQPEAKKRSILFPYVWVALFVLARIGYGYYAESDPEISSDVVHVLTVIGGYLMLFGIAIWWLVRGQSNWLLRLVPVGVVAAIPFAITTLFHIDFDGDMQIRGITWRNAEKADELLDKAEPSQAIEGITDWTETENDYPGFLGRGPWPQVKGVSLATDWESNPPEELWRQPIGAGWSSFAIVGQYAFTQEQRGEEELVTCYKIDSGEIVWVHGDPTRFDPEEFGGGIGGHGPRATPTIYEKKVFTQGGTGILNCLDALTGTVLWSHDLHAEFDADNLIWGKSASPLVVPEEQMVIVGPGAKLDVQEEDGHNASLVAFDLETGDIRWQAGWRVTSYASPVLAELDGEKIVLQINQDYLTAHALEDGHVLWEHPWPGRSDADANVSQPIPLGDGRLFLCKGYGVGASLLELNPTAEELPVTPLWSPAVKPVMKTKFSNVVIHENHVFGLDGGILQCIELETGKSKWKKRRRPKFGHGQLLLVGDKLLIVTEQGEVVLAEASSDKYRELAKLQALDSDLVCWNNLALSNDLMLVRNAEEVAAYRLPLSQEAE